MLLQFEKKCLNYLFSQFENKEIRFEDFNHLVCTMEMLPELGAIRKLLRDRFPNKKAGTCMLLTYELSTHHFTEECI